LDAQAGVSVPPCLLRDIETDYRRANRNDKGARAVGREPAPLRGRHRERGILVEIAERRVAPVARNAPGEGRANLERQRDKGSPVGEPSSTPRIMGQRTMPSNLEIRFSTELQGYAIGGREQPPRAAQRDHRLATGIAGTLMESAYDLAGELRALG